MLTMQGLCAGYTTWGSQSPACWAGCSDALIWTPPSTSQPTALRSKLQVRPQWRHPPCPLHTSHKGWGQKPARSSRVHA